MKKYFFFFAVLLFAAHAAMAQDLEQTVAPMIHITNYDGIGEVVIELLDEDSDAIIYVSITNTWYDNSDEWFQFFEPITINIPGLYVIKSYAIAPGKSASEIMRWEVVVTNTDDDTYEIDGVYYKEIDNEVYVSYKRFPPSDYPSYVGDVVIPDSVTFFGAKRRVYGISREAFYNCSELTSITLPPTIGFVGCEAFNQCFNLSGVYISDLAAWCNIDFEWLMPETNPLEFAQHLYLNGEEIKDLVIPESVTEVKPHAFRCFSGITSVTLPHVTSIGSGAFDGCSGLTSMDLGPDILNIDDYAFTTCMSHERLICRAMNPPAVQLPYYYGYERVKLFVPAESIEAYRAHDVWGRFAHIVPFIGAGPGDINGDGNIAISDVTNLIDQLLSGNMSVCSDVNGDGVVTITDVTCLIDMLLNGI